MQTTALTCIHSISTVSACTAPPQTSKWQRERDVYTVLCNADRDAPLGVGLEQDPEVHPGFLVWAFRVGNLVVTELGQCILIHCLLKGFRPAYQLIFCGHLQQRSSCVSRHVTAHDHSLQCAELHAGVDYGMPARRVPHRLKNLWCCMLTRQSIAVVRVSYSLALLGFLGCAAASSVKTL